MWLSTFLLAVIALHQIEGFLAERCREHKTMRGTFLAPHGRPGVPIPQQGRSLGGTISGTTAKSEQSAPASAIVPVGGRVAEAPSPVGARKGTDRDREPVDEPDRVGPFPCGKLVPELVLRGSRTGGLADTRRAMDAVECEEERGMVPLNIPIHGLILVVAKDLTDDLHGQHLTVGEDGLRSPRAQPTTSEDGGECFINQAGGRDHEIIQVHWAPPSDSGSAPLMTVPET